MLIFKKTQGYNGHSFTRKVFRNDISRLLEIYTKVKPEYILDEIEMEELKSVTYHIPEQFIKLPSGIRQFFATEQTITIFY